MLEAFGGEASLGMPYISMGKYPAFGFDELLFNGIDMLTLTRSFEGFASLSGIFDGYVKDFQYRYDAPQRFKLWLHNVRRKGVKQVITAGIVNVIALNSAEVRAAMKLLNMEKFKYKFLRIGASVEDGVLRLSSARDGAPVEYEQAILLMGKRSGFLRLILRVAGRVEGDWTAVWGSLKKSVTSMKEGSGLEVIH